MLYLFYPTFTTSSSPHHTTLHHTHQTTDIHINTPNLILFHPYPLPCPILAYAVTDSTWLVYTTHLEILGLLYMSNLLSFEHHKLLFSYYRGQHAVVKVNVFL